MYTPESRKMTEQLDWRAKQPSQVVCVSEDNKMLRSLRHYRWMPCKHQRGRCHLKVTHLNHVKLESQFETLFVLYRRTCQPTRPNKIKNQQRTTKWFVITERSWQSPWELTKIAPRPPNYTTALLWHKPYSEQGPGTENESGFRYQASALNPRLFSISRHIKHTDTSNILQRRLQANQSKDHVSEAPCQIKQAGFFFSHCMMLAVYSAVFCTSTHP